MAADLLINGNHSLFATLPAERDMMVGGRAVHVRVTSEAGRLDLNEAALPTIERLLAGLGWDGASRAMFVEALRARRSEGRRLASMDEVRLVAAGAGGGAGACLERLLTVSSGRAEPEPTSVDPALARLIGLAPSAEVEAAPTPLAAGSAIRVDLTGAPGGSHTAVLRIGGLLDQPVLLSSWERQASCLQ